MHTRSVNQFMPSCQVITAVMMHGLNIKHRSSRSSPTVPSSTFLSRQAFAYPGRRRRCCGEFLKPGSLAIISATVRRAELGVSGILVYTLKQIPFCEGFTLMLVCFIFSNFMLARPGDQHLKKASRHTWTHWSRCDMRSVVKIRVRSDCCACTLLQQASAPLSA